MTNFDFLKKDEKFSSFADVAIRIGVVMLGTKYFGFWGVAFGDGATWMIGAIIFVPMLIIEYRKIYKQYGFKML